MIELMEFAEYVAKRAYGPKQDQGAAMTLDGMMHYLNKIKSSKIGTGKLDEYRELNDFTAKLYDLRTQLRLDTKRAKEVAIANADPTLEATHADH